VSVGTIQDRTSPGHLAATTTPKPKVSAHKKPLLPYGEVAFLCPGVTVEIAFNCSAR